MARHADQDGRIRIIDKLNGGPSSARNAGIAAATGDYICFLDCDDAYEANACARLALAASSEAPDVIAFGWKCDLEQAANRWLAERTCVRDAYYPQFAPALLFEEMTNPYLRSAVRRELLEEQGISFDESLRVGEDCAFLFALYPRIGTARLISDRLYRYRMPHEGSIMSGTQEGTPEKCLDDLNMAISIFGDWGRAGFLDSYGAELMHWFIKLQLYTILRLPAPTRDHVVSLVKQLWLAHFTEDELRALAVPAHDQLLIALVLAAADDGALAESGMTLRTSMLRWRISEYGVSDLATTLIDRLPFR